MNKYLLKNHLTYFQQDLITEPIKTSIALYDYADSGHNSEKLTC